MEGLLAFPAVLLLVFSVYSTDLLTRFRIQTTIYPLGIRVGVGNLALLVMILTVGVLMQRRYFGNREVERLRQQTLAGELEQARELQLRVLVPEEIHLAHLQVQAEYHPAQTVGGDFFQVIPLPGDALLVVVGDVSGKGISAAMLVAVLVGTIRTCAEQGAGPVQILEALNTRLLGRAGGHFATCVALRIEANGHAELANAGHLPPYLNGQALGFSGSLPLGLVPEPGLEMHPLTLAAGDYLTLLTDGVLEARAADGMLLGFERTGELSTQPASQIVQAAVAFGQDDDITVVTLAYQSVPTAVLV